MDDLQNKFTVLLIINLLVLIQTFSVFIFNLLFFIVSTLSVDRLQYITGLSSTTTFGLVCNLVIYVFPNLLQD